MHNKPRQAMWSAILSFIPVFYCLFLSRCIIYMSRTCVLEWGLKCQTPEWFFLGCRRLEETREQMLAGHIFCLLPSYKNSLPSWQFVLLLLLCSSACPQIPSDQAPVYEGWMHLKYCNIDNTPLPSNNSIAFWHLHIDKSSLIYSLRKYKLVSQPKCNVCGGSRKLSQGLFLPYSFPYFGSWWQTE